MQATNSATYLRQEPHIQEGLGVLETYRSEQALWSRIAEGGFDGFMARMYGAGKV
jgi:hypothetical protein